MNSKTKVPIKAITGALAAFMAFLAVIPSITSGTRADSNRAVVISFERTSPVHEAWVNIGTAWADLGLPTELRAVCEIAEDRKSVV